MKVNYIKRNTPSEEFPDSVALICFNRKSYDSKENDYNWSIKFRNKEHLATFETFIDIDKAREKALEAVKKCSKTKSKGKELEDIFDAYFEEYIKGTTEMFNGLKKLEITRKSNENRK
jgi:uncharacterized protein YegP (UPF0339 family)